MALKSWDCKGCTNTEYRITKDGIFEYCIPLSKNKLRTEWRGDEVVCLDKVEGKGWRDNGE